MQVSIGIQMAGDKHSFRKPSALRHLLAIAPFMPVPQPGDTVADNARVRRTRTVPRVARTLARPARDDTGASLVEFALVLPLFMMVLLGMFTGGIAYNRKLAVTQATREGARYGATLPLAAEATVDLWLSRVANVVVASADGELQSTTPGMQVCVSYVPGSGTPRRVQITGSTTTYSDATCFTDSRGSEARVQVVGSRTSKFEALVWSQDVALTSHAVSRFEGG
jgi:Flp pilus assembly protein TadG